MKTEPKPTHTPTPQLCTPYCACNQKERDVALDQCDRAIRAVAAHEELLFCLKMARGQMFANGYDSEFSPLKYIDQVIADAEGK